MRGVLKRVEGVGRVSKVRILGLGFSSNCFREIELCRLMTVVIVVAEIGIEMTYQRQLPQQFHLSQLPTISHPH